MAFKASKERKRRAPGPVAEGTQLIASAAIRDWYQAQLRAITVSMLEDYKKTIGAALETKSLQRFYSQDASAQAQLSDVMAALNKKWISLFKTYAKATAEAFAEKVDKHSRSTCWHSLSTAGVQQPRMGYLESVSNTLGAAQKFNNTLITGIQADVHEKIFNSVMLSLTSPNPEEQGTSGIENALKKAGTFSRARIELIARDQNSKLYSSLNIERMKDNGVDKFKWIHSSAGKTPRPSHVSKDEEIFAMDDPRLWTGPKADQGPPGWAINCRCRAVPVID